MDHTDEFVRAVVFITYQAINDKKSRDINVEPFLYRVAKDGYALDSLKDYLKAFGISKKDLVKKQRRRDEYD
jgi:hypothetical protein